MLQLYQQWLLLEISLLPARGNCLQCLTYRSEHLKSYLERMAEISWKSGQGTLLFHFTSCLKVLQAEDKIWDVFVLLVKRLVLQCDNSLIKRFKFYWKPQFVTFNDSSWWDQIVIQSRSTDSDVNLHDGEWWAFRDVMYYSTKQFHLNRSYQFSVWCISAFYQWYITIYEW